MWSHVSRHGNESSWLRTRQAELAPRREPLDPRMNAYRPDLADVRLLDLVTAAHFVRAADHFCTAPRAPLRTRDDREAPLASEILFGETFEVLEIAGEWAWGRAQHDGYVGYAPASALAPAATTRTPTHKVSAASALLFSAPDIKSPVIHTLPMNARLRAAHPEGEFLLLDSGGYVHCRHVQQLAGRAPSHLEAARLLLGTPYLWGGRTREGVDCSGLVQAALFAAGRECPRDSDMQREWLGRPVDGEPEAGDLLFFPGHVGIIESPAMLLHANAYWMSTVIEPLEDVVERLRPKHPKPILAHRRLDPA
jgi:cell wall-associated NlpC family hydrolase